MKKKWVLAKISESTMLVFINEHGNSGATTLDKAGLHNDSIINNPHHDAGFRPLMVIVADNGERFLPL